MTTLRIYTGGADRNTDGVITRTIAVLAADSTEARKAIAWRLTHLNQRFGDGRTVDPADVRITFVR